jgi:hypothetical protein
MGMQQTTKIIITISAILNAILLMVLFGTLPFFLYTSVIINMLLVWYSLKSINKINDIEEDMQSILELTESFADHLEELHSFELYYGDQELQNMIEHSKSVINDIIDIQEKYFEVEVVTEKEDEEEDEEEYDQQANTPAPQPQEE